MDSNMRKPILSDTETHPTVLANIEAVWALESDEREKTIKDIHDIMNTHGCNHAGATALALSLRNAAKDYLDSNPKAARLVPKNTKEEYNWRDIMCFLPVEYLKKHAIMPEEENPNK